ITARREAGSHRWSWPVCPGLQFVAFRLHPGSPSMLRTIGVVLAVLMLGCADAAAQSAAPSADGQVDVFDLWRKVRNKEPAPDDASWDYRKAMKAFAPVIGAKPSSGALIRVAGNVAFYPGAPSTTPISSVVTSLTFSTKKQTSLTDRMAIFARDDRVRYDADHPFQWTSLETNQLGTSADTTDSIQTGFDFFRLHHSAYYRVRPSLFAGGGLYFDTHTSVGPHDDEAAWQQSAYVTYSEAHGLPLDSQSSAGVRVDLMWDSRDSFIKAKHGCFAKMGYRAFFEGFRGGDSHWERLNLHLRTYRPVTASGRHRIAVW